MTWTWTRAKCTTSEHERKRAPCHTFDARSHAPHGSSVLESHIIRIVIHVRLSLSSPFSPSTSICPSPSSPFSSLSCTSSCPTELDNLIAMQNLRTSANKGSNDAYDVSVSLTDVESTVTRFPVTTEPNRLVNGPYWNLNCFNPCSLAVASECFGLLRN